MTLIKSVFNVVQDNTVSDSVRIRALFPRQHPSHQSAVCGPIRVLRLVVLRFGGVGATVHTLSHPCQQNKIMQNEACGHGCRDPVVAEIYFGTEDCEATFHPSE
eukprot:GHVU01016364.1.p2 GENE.GHVU01016364.1~~GHVU01016364.1.p2  ORF type:complete len:104 (+),score=6.02 GHVU01016364.1:530-841(+)